MVRVLKILEDALSQIGPHAKGAPFAVLEPQRESEVVEHEDLGDDDGGVGRSRMSVMLRLLAKRVDSEGLPLAPGEFPDRGELIRADTEVQPTVVLQINALLAEPYRIEVSVQIIKRKGVLSLQFIV